MAKNPFSVQDHAEITTLGMEFALAEILGALVGWWLDEKFGTIPWCLIGGVFLGFAVGFYRVCQVARSAAKQKENKNGRC